MSTPSWQEHLQRRLQSLIKTISPIKVAVIGIGNEQRGDDAAGVLVARGLHSAGNLLVIDAGAAPENVTGRLRDFQPMLVLFVDAVHMSARPGAVEWIDESRISGFSASTHTLPLDVLAQFLRTEFGCHVALLGIQPASTDFSAPPSQEVLTAVENLTQQLERVLRP